MQPTYVMKNPQFDSKYTVTSALAIGLLKMSFDKTLLRYLRKLVQFSGNLIIRQWVGPSSVLRSCYRCLLNSFMATQPTCLNKFCLYIFDIGELDLFCAASSILTSSQSIVVDLCLSVNCSPYLQICIVPLRFMIV